MSESGMTIETPEREGGCSPATCSVMWLRTASEPRFYVYELRGVCFVTFVPEKDKANSANFPTNKAPIQEWKKVVESIAGCELEAVTPFV